MTLHVPLSIELRSTGGNRVITGEATAVRYRTAIPGGYASCTVDLQRPLAAFAADVAGYATLRVTDTRHAGAIWEGRLEDPGRSTGDGGDVWQIAAVGPSAHAQDVEAPYVAIDSSLESWVRGPGTQKYVTDGMEEMYTPGGSWLGSCLRLTASPSAVIDPGDVATYLYPVFGESGQRVATITGFTFAGISDANHKLGIRVASDDTLTGFELADYVSAGNVTPTTFLYRQGVDWTGSTYPYPVVLWEWIDNLNTYLAGSATWAVFGGPLIVRPFMYTKAGVEISAASPFNVNAATSDEIIADLLGTRLTKWDGANADLTAGTSGLITHFAYPDPVTVDKMLTDLMDLEGGLYWWAAWESNAAGKARFEWSTWPTSVRYELDPDDGLDLPGSSDGLYDAVSVRWKDPKGVIKRTRVAATVDALTAAGITREATLDLGDNLVTDSASAYAAGAAFLADHATPRGSGTVTVTGPVLDRVTGRLILPHELLPGTLVHVRGLNPSAQTLTATTRNGTSIFRCVAVDYDSSTASAVCQLDAAPRSTGQDIAGLGAAIRDRRRR